MSGFFGNILKLISGNIAAQTIMVGTMPLVTRLYSPSEFGIFSVFFSFTMVIGAFSNLGFNNTIILPEKHSESLNLLTLSMLLSLGISVIAMGAVGLYKVLPEISILEKMGNSIWLVPFGIFLIGGPLNITAWATRQKTFREMAISRVLESSTSRSFALITGFFLPLGAWGLIIGKMSGETVRFFYLAKHTLSNQLNPLKQSVSGSEMKRLACKYKDFPIYGTWSSFLNIGSARVPVILLAGLFSPEIAGFYAVSTQIIRMPVELVGGAFFNVFLQRSVILKNEKEKLALETSRMFAYLIYLGLPVVIVLLFTGDWLFTLVLGEKWTETGVYAQILTPSFLLLFVSRPMTAFFIAFERQKTQLLFNATLFLTGIGIILTVGFLTNSPRAIIGVLSFSNTAILFGFIIYLFKIIDIGYWCLIRLVIEKTFVLTPLIAGFAIVRFFLYPDIAMCMMALALSLSAQAAIILRKEPLLMEKIKSLRMRKNVQ